LRKRIRSLREADLGLLSDEAVATRVRRIIDQYHIQLRPLELTGVYRARINEGVTPFMRASDLWYPPASAVTRPGRLNKQGQRCFYAASVPNTAIYELHPIVGQTVTVLIASTRTGVVETLRVAFLGLERSLSPEVSHLGESNMFRSAPRAAVGAGNYRKWLAIDDYLSEILGQEVAHGDELQYKPSIALAELLFTAPGLDAINYPSVVTGDKGINIALSPARADQLLRPFEAWMVQIGDDAVLPETGEVIRGVTFLRRSEEIGSDGVIRWRAPGVGTDLSEILRFVRRRMETLSSRPGPVSSK
jgi:hypothetical protein